MNENRPIYVLQGQFSKENKVGCQKEIAFFLAILVCLSLMVDIKALLDLFDIEKARPYLVKAEKKALFVVDKLKKQPNLPLASAASLVSFFGHMFLSQKVFSMLNLSSRFNLLAPWLGLGALSFYATTTISLTHALSPAKVKRSLASYTLSLLSVILLFKLSRGRFRWFLASSVDTLGSFVQKRGSLPATLGF